LSLAAALPFELTSPVARLGPLQLSSVELFLYAAVGLWGASRLAGAGAALAGAGALWRRLGRSARRLPEPHRAVAAWSLVLIASAAVAPVSRPEAIKFALRSLGGVALYLAASDLLDSRRAVWRTAVALGVGAGLAALLAAAEPGIPAIAARLRPFHGTGFGTLGLVRASGPFQYPNIAAMYFEAALPVVIAAGVTGVTGVAAAAPVGQRWRRWIGALTVVTALIMVYALLLTASRAGLITALAVLSGIALFAAHERRLRRMVLAFVAGALILTALAQSASPLLAQRLRFWDQRPWYRSTLTPAPFPAVGLPAVLSIGARVRVALTIRNDGAIAWDRTGRRAVYLSYHWIDEPTGVVKEFEGVRTALPSDLAPGATTTVTAEVSAPARPGRYLLRWDLVQEQVTWFSDRGDRGLRQLVVVVAAGAAEDLLARGDRARAAAVPEPTRPEEVPRRELWRAGLAMWREHPWLGVGPDNFRRVYGGYLRRPDPDTRLHANNFYIETLATLGAAGLVALAGVMVALAGAVRRAGRDPRAGVMALGIGGGMAAYAVHGTLDYFLEFTPTYGLLWLLAGMIVALAGQSPEAGPAAGAPADAGRDDIGGEALGSGRP
jgi:hypothetical protein